VRSNFDASATVGGRRPRRRAKRSRRMRRGPARRREPDHRSLILDQRDRQASVIRARLPVVECSSRAASRGRGPPSDRLARSRRRGSPAVRWRMRVVVPTSPPLRVLGDHVAISPSFSRSSTSRRPRRAPSADPGLPAISPRASPRRSSRWDRPLHPEPEGEHAVRDRGVTIAVLPASRRTRRCRCRPDRRCRRTSVAPVPDMSNQKPLRPAFAARAEAQPFVDADAPGT
jgi:hypothetical protein